MYAFMGLQLNNLPTIKRNAFNKLYLLRHKKAYSEQVGLNRH